ncbi:MAG: hypothetical protein ACQETL_15030 [Bacteroidota bacterium]
MISFRNNTAKFEEIVFYNEDKIVEFKNFNEGKNLSKRNDPILADAFESCPDGYESVGSCVI